MMTLTQIRAEGKKAFNKGLNLADNPHKNKGSKHEGKFYLKAWANGWKHAQFVADSKIYETPNDMQEGIDITPIPRPGSGKNVPSKSGPKDPYKEKIEKLLKDNRPKSPRFDPEPGTGGRWDGYKELEEDDMNNVSENADYDYGKEDYSHLDRKNKYELRSYDNVGRAKAVDRQRTNNTGDNPLSEESKDIVDRSDVNEQNMSNDDHFRVLAGLKSWRDFKFHKVEEMFQPEEKVESKFGDGIAESFGEDDCDDEKITNAVDEVDDDEEINEEEVNERFSDLMASLEVEQVVADSVMDIYQEVGLDKQQLTESIAKLEKEILGPQKK